MTTLEWLLALGFEQSSVPLEKVGSEGLEAYRVKPVRFLGLRKRWGLVRGCVRKGRRANDFLRTAFKSGSQVLRYYLQLVHELAQPAF